MSIQVGDSLPDVTIKTWGEGPEDLNITSTFGTGKHVIFAVPGAFTPGCSNTHFPGFVVLADQIKAKGVQSIGCLSVNDAFVMGAWAKSQNAEEILMLADGSGDLTKELGLVLDARGFGMGERCKRFAMIVEDGKVTYLAIDDKGIENSTAEKVLEAL